MHSRVPIRQQVLLHKFIRLEIINVQLALMEFPEGDNPCMMEILIPEKYNPMLFN